MTALLKDVCCACIPREALPVLGESRCFAGVTVALTGDRAWVRWEPGDVTVLRHLLPVASVTLYVPREGRWFRYGHHLPVSDVPDDREFGRLSQVLIPAPICALPPPVLPLDPLSVTLVPDALTSRPRPATAVACSLAELERWADSVPEVRLAALHGCHFQGRVLMQGVRLPFWPAQERFWGERVLVPLGYRTEPDLPECGLRAALGLEKDDLLVMLRGRPQLIHASVFLPLSRARIRLANNAG